VTTWLPGRSEVFTHGFTCRPFSTAFLATRPAAISTPGFEVLVQEVIAAITTSPLPMSKFSPSTRKRLLSVPGLANTSPSMAALNSAGRFGQHDAVLRPLRPGHRRHDAEMSSSRVSVNTGSGSDGSRHMPWALA
jgi:hypothetical protein